MADKQIHILYSVLDWGLGHATRSIPVIRYLQESGVKVSISGEGDSFFLLKQLFPECDFYLLHGIKVRYTANGSLALKMALSVPKNLFAIFREHLEIKNLVKKLKPDAIISDNRFGAWSDKVPCVFMTHQLNIKTPKYLHWLDPLLFRLNKFFISHYDKVWIPDFQGEDNLTGDLTHNPKSLAQFPHQFIGPLSRFTNSESSDIHERYEMIFIISGPEPQRSIFEKLCIEQSLALDLKTLLVKGLPKENKVLSEKNLKIVSHLDTETLKGIMKDADYIICRGGCTTIFDLCSIGKTALCIPTPGQTEQEYMNVYLAGKNYIITQKQSEFDLKSGIKKLSSCIPMTAIDVHLMKEEISLFIKSLHTR